jgi:hypothetical protein
MVRLVRHRQTKGPATARLNLKHRATSRLHKKNPDAEKSDAGVLKGKGVIAEVDCLMADLLGQKNAPEICNGLFDVTVRRGRSDSRQRHRPIGSAAECDGLEDPPYAHATGIASRLAPTLPRRVGDKLQGQASSGAVWDGSQSKRDLRFFRELLPLRLSKANHQSSE